MDERFDPTYPINQAELQLHTSRYTYAFQKIREYAKNRKIKILDIACGVGYGTAYLAKNINADLVGIDVDTKTVALAKKTYSDRKIKFQQGNLKHMLYPTATFDIVVCFETIEHVTKENGKKGLKELYRVLKPGGLLILSSPNRSCTHLMRRFMPTHHNKHHLHEYTVKELLLTIQKTGFTQTRVCGQYLFIPPIYLIAQKTNFLDWFFRPYDFLPPTISRYMLLTATKQ